MSTPELLAAALVAGGALAAAVRLALLRRVWISVLLAVLALASGALLYLALFPPLLPIGGETLVVATAEAPAGTRAEPGERLVALPEAPRIAGAERVPDLATALRRHGAVRRIRILGRGLPARDRDVAAGVPVDFAPMKLPRGLVRLDPPADTPAGAAFTLAGAAQGLAGGSAELRDPAGRRVDRRSIGPDGAFTLGGTARAPGLAAFTLRLRGHDGKTVSDTPVPLRTLPERPLRALLVGAPSPEAKYLRRWAEDAGIDLASRLEAGGGVDLGDGTVRLDAASLRKADVVIIDDRALAALGAGARAVLSRAVAGGLGVVVRMTGPATAGTRAGWRALGLTPEGGSETAPVALAPLAPDAEALLLRRGPGSADVRAEVNALDDPAPELEHWVLRGGAAFVPAVRDAEGAVLAGWQQRGQGRAALWTVPDSFALVLAGQGERYGQWWSDTLSAVARPADLFRPELPPLVEAGERVTICGLARRTRAEASDGTAVALVIDPAAGAKGCAAYWPRQSGIHTLVQTGPQGERRFAFMVLPQGSLPGIEAQRTGTETRLWAARQAVTGAPTPPERHGPAWPWFLAWLAVTGALWWGERRLRSKPTG
ncbi:MAG: carboxypeptidase regulatory-like domain-containing protein [Porphyrobacter sp.]|nr:carboxypeptidase regulatory-like domain-containing protein [Porphyrobacter sp.]